LRSLLVIDTDRSQSKARNRQRAPQTALFKERV